MLYEDDFCLVAHKPAGMAVHPDGSSDAVTLDHVVAAHYAAAGESCAVRHVHRLDRDTSGPVLYAKNEFAQLILDEDLRRKDIARRYAAIVRGEVSPALKVIDQPIGKDRHHPSRRRVSPGGQPAVTRITGAEVWRGASLVKVELETGRTHQIRVHLSHAGHPLVGDALYGGSAGRQPNRGTGPAGAGRKDPGRWNGHGHSGADPGPRSGAELRPLPEAARSFGRQALHGETLAFAHPWTGEEIVVTDPWPKDMEALREALTAQQS